MTYSHNTFFGFTALGFVLTFVCGDCTASIAPSTGSRYCRRLSAPGIAFPFFLVALAASVSYYIARGCFSIVHIHIDSLSYLSLLFNDAMLSTHLSLMSFPLISTRKCSRSI
jgi:hypothetical protein